MKYKGYDQNRSTVSGNIGDCIQNLAVEKIYEKAGVPKEKLLLVNRDELPSYNKRCALVMQGWFANTIGCNMLPWNENISPIFLGFHLNDYMNSRADFVEKNMGKLMKNFEPIGCRDRNTAQFLQKQNVNAYFSGCMTLTFDKRERAPQNGKIFVVDLNKKILKKLPDFIKKQADYSITHYYEWDHKPLTDEDAVEFENKAREILEIYKKEAKLVITSRIHVAMPCVAMGIPVIFITKQSDDIRFDVLQGILPIYTLKDLRFINWSPEAVDISHLKKAITENAIAQITGKNKEVALENLTKICETLEPIEFLPRWVKFFRKINFFGK
jgi:hypothetical protein